MHSSIKLTLAIVILGAAQQSVQSQDPGRAAGPLQTDGDSEKPRGVRILPQPVMNPDPQAIEPQQPLQLPEPSNDTFSEEVQGLGKPDPRSEILRAEAAWNPQPISGRALTGATPSDLSFTHQNREVMSPEVNRSDAVQTAFWHASGLFSQPTYFDDIDAERYGYRHCLQPARSGVKFYCDVVMLPWEVIKNCPHEKIYHLGHERPGTPVGSVREKRHY